jgi:enoyl-CoA hydratase
VSDAPVLTERRDGVLVITLNRPEARNAFNRAQAEGLAAALTELDENDELRVAVLTGAGNGFSAGMDLKAFVKGETPYVEGRGFAGIAQGPPKKPIVAAIEGFALAGGLEVALACDLVVAAKDAKLGIPEVKVGLAAGAGALIRLPRRIPYHLAMELALTGEPISGERGAEIGLVNRTVEPGQAVEEAIGLAEQIARNAPLSLDASKQVIAASSNQTEDEAWERQGAIVGVAFGSEDAQEGAKAFAEKRDPVWKGK